MPIFRSSPVFERPELAGRRLGLPTTEDFESIKPENAHDACHQADEQVDGMQHRKTEQLAKGWDVEHQAERHDHPANNPTESHIWRAQRAQDEARLGTIDENQAQVGYDKRGKGERTGIQLTLAARERDEKDRQHNHQYAYSLQ